MRKCPPSLLPWIFYRGFEDPEPTDAGQVVLVVIIVIVLVAGWLCHRKPASFEDWELGDRGRESRVPSFARIRCCERWPRGLGYRPSGVCGAC